MLFSLKSVEAHCDIPCGIYETDTMRHAADTCAKMIEKIEALGTIDTIEKQNTLVRCVMVKEKHAERVKHELAVLWGDYFKPEHLEKFPDLHTTFWKAIKQAGEVKHTVSADEAAKLQASVANIADMFTASKS